MAHPNARLSVFGRQLLVSRVVVQRWPAATVAEQLGVSRATVYKWCAATGPRAIPASPIAPAGVPEVARMTSEQLKRAAFSKRPQLSRIPDYEDPPWLEGLNVGKDLTVRLSG